MFVNGEDVAELAHVVIGATCTVLMSLLIGVLWFGMRKTGRQVLAAETRPSLDLGIGANALTAILSLASFACCVAMAMPQVHIVAYCGDLGYGVARGAEMLALMLAFGIISRVGSGFIADRLGGLTTLLLGATAQGIALAMYLFFDGASLALPGLSAVRPIPGRHRAELCDFIVRETMPAREAGVRVGIVIMVSVMGMSFGGWVSGAIFDMAGSYSAAFLNGIAWNLVNVGIAMLLLIRARRRVVFS